MGKAKATKGMCGIGKKITQVNKMDPKSFKDKGIPR